MFLHFLLILGREVFRNMSLHELKAKLLQLEKDLTRTQNKVIELMEEKQTISPNNHVYCYFNHSLILEHDVNSRLIMGSFHVKNMSNEHKKTPIILIKINSEENFNFTEKFLTEEQSQIRGFQWRRMHLQNVDPKNHFVLKPTTMDTLPPHEGLTFQNFQIKIPFDASITVEGFVYFNESNNGVPAS